MSLPPVIGRGNPAAPSVHSADATAVFGDTAFDTAILMLAGGLWPVPIYPPGVKLGDRTTKGKEPIGKAWGGTRNTYDTLYATFQEHPGAGVGLCLGPGRGPGGSWPIDIEGDGPEAEESLKRLLGGDVIVTLGWSSARGWHWIFLVDTDRMTALLAPLGFLEGKGIKTGVYKLPEYPGLEIRVGGYKPGGVIKQVQSVCPPTVGTDGKPREGNGVSTIDYAPESLYAALEQAATRRPVEGEHPATKGPAPRKARDGPRGTLDIEERAVRYLAKCEPAISGQRGHDTAFKVACKIGPGFDLPREAALRLLRDHYNPRCEPPWSDRELEHKVDDAYEKQPSRGFLLDAPPSNGRRNGDGGNGQANGDGAATEEALDYRKLTRAELGLTRASDINAEPVDWLWQDRIPLAMLTLLAGEGDDGKSMITIMLAAAASTGGKFPDGTQAPLCRVIILAAEDSTKKTIIPRLIAAGANMANVDILVAKITYRDRKGRLVVSPQCLADLDYWRTVFEKAGEGQPQQVLFIVDTLPSLMKGVNDSKNNEIRALMEPFIDDVIDPLNVAMLGVTHLNKSVDHKTPAHKILGSVAYPNLSRSVFCTYRDDDDPTQKRRFMCHIKMNVGERGPTFAYAIEKAEIEANGQAIKIAKVVFEETPVDLSAQDILNAKRGRPPKETHRCEQFIRDALARENDQIYTELREEWEKGKGSRDTFRRVVDRLLEAGELTGDGGPGERKQFTLHRGSAEAQR